MDATDGLHSRLPSQLSQTSMMENLCDIDALAASQTSKLQRTSSRVADVFRRLSEDNLDDMEVNHWLVDSYAFSAFITGAVILNTLELGLEAEFPDEMWLWSGCEHAFTSIFVLEALMKLYVYQWEYFADRWNILDFLVASTAALDVWILRRFEGSVLDLQSFSILRIMRIARLSRVLSLVGRFQRLVLIFGAVADSIRTTAWAGLLLGLCVYVCAIFCVEYVGQGTRSIYPGYAEDIDDIETQELLVEFNPYLFFGSMPRSMLTLFGIATLSEWREIVWPILVKQPIVICFFVVFTMFVTFGVMNVIVGMIVEGVMSRSRSFEMETTSQKKARSVSILNRIQMCLKSIDTDADGHISAHDLEEKLLNGGLIAELMNEIDLPRGFTAAEFHRLLDINGTGWFKEDVFVENLYRLIDSSPFQQTCLVQMSINQLKFMMRISNRRMNRLEHICEQLLSTMKRSAVGPVSSVIPNSSDDILGKKLPSPASSLPESTGHRSQFSERRRRGGEILTQASNVSACSPSQSETRQSDLSYDQGSFDHSVIEHGVQTADINCNFMQTVPLPKHDELQAVLEKAYDDQMLHRSPLDSIVRLGALVGPAFKSQFETQVRVLREELDERIKSCVGNALNACFTPCSSTNNSEARNVTKKDQLLGKDQFFSNEELSADSRSEEQSLHFV